jgi:hypothetical protein
MVSFRSDWQEAFVISSHPGGALVPTPSGRVPAFRKLENGGSPGFPLRRGAKNSEVIEEVQIINGMASGNITRALAGKHVGTIIFKQT